MLIRLDGGEYLMFNVTIVQTGDETGEISFDLNEFQNYIP